MEALDHPMAVEEEARTTPYTCRVCGAPFDTREEVVAHWRTHPEEERYPGRTRTATPPPRRNARRTTPPRQTRRAAPKAAPKIDAVQLGLTLSYGLAGQAFGMFGPDPPQARGAVGAAMALTAVPAGAGLTKVAKKTPAYPLLEIVFGSGALLSDLTPLAVPAIVGMYAYAPNEAKKRLRPMTASIMGLILFQTFGPDMPAAPEDLTPIAIPEWIRDLVNGLLPPPE